MAYPEEQLQEVGPVVNPVVNNLFKQREAERQKQIQEAKGSPVANNLQQRVDAYNVAPNGAVGQDDPIIQQSAKMAQNYAPMLMGQQPKTTEQIVTDRALKQTKNFKAPSMEVNPNDPSSGMNALASMYTSPEQEEKLRKASLANQRILAIGGALRHIGNIYHTTKYSPSQQFNSPVQEERARYLQEKSVRDAANVRYLNYQQAKAEQDRKMKQLENEQNYRNEQLRLRQQELDRLDKQYELNERKADWQRQYQQGTLDIKREQQKLNEEYKRGMLSVAQYRAATYALNAGKKGGGGGGTGAKYWAYDEEGNIHYYPNKSMYEQGVYEFGQGQSTTEEYSKGKDVLGKEQKGQRKRSVTSMGGERARQARDKARTASGQTSRKKKLPGQGNTSNGKKKLP